MAKAAAKQEAQVSPAEQAMLDMMRSGGKEKKGLGLVWGSTTDAIGEVFGGVSTIARAGRILAEQAESHALIGKSEASKELLETYGFGELTGLEAVAMAKQLKTMLLNS